MATWDEMYRMRSSQMTTPSTGGRNALGSQPAAPTNIWDTQPKSANEQMNRSSQFGAMQPQGLPQPAPAGTNALVGSSYGGGRGDWQGYGPNAGGLRVDPTYLPEVWDYQESPEYRNRLAWAQRDLNRLLLSRGRSDSTGGINALARQQSEMAADEIDKQYQRALQANMANYGRYFGANTENYGRTRGEDETGWNRAAYLGEQDWNRNWQLANMGLNATTTGVQSGNSTGMALANLLSQNGANQASLAIQRGLVSADTIQALLNAGFTYLQIEQMIRGASTGTAAPTTTSPVWSEEVPTATSPRAGLSRDSGGYLDWSR